MPLNVGINISRNVIEKAMFSNNALCSFPSFGHGLNLDSYNKSHITLVLQILREESRANCLSIKLLRAMRS
jgi:hypothetical protein